MIRNDPPNYYERVKNEARERWEQLEKYPDLAAPWHQLFRQIQSPRHVISELLQNADDVGATWASIIITDDHFIFKHNGLDFDEDNLKSLCRFGYSNKRTLHTIGFRGIGFKSTFSIGDYVEVFSPTLSIAFEKRRFTEPIWIDDSIKEQEGITQVKVKIADPKIGKFLEDNSAQWIDNPIPILFFRNIQVININEQQIIKQRLRDGPIPNSSWISLKSKHEHDLLLVKSEPEEISPEALDEVREERSDNKFEVPPCQVEIILGLKNQQLFAILPTNVKIDLPFSCNGPFIQDPARLGIKDPLRSPLNRWLLERIGNLLFTSFTSWIRNNDLSIEQRAHAYQLFPKPHPSDSNSIASYCEATIIDSFQEKISDQDCLLTSVGTLSNSSDCIELSSELFKIWPADQLATLFGDGRKFTLAKEISSGSRKILNQWDLIDRKSSSEILDRLIEDPCPMKPDIDGLKSLWYYVYTNLENWSWSNRYYYKTKLKIVPVKEQPLLNSADNVNVLSGKEKQLTEDEFHFLENYLIILDPEWATFIKIIQNQLNEKTEASNKPHTAIVSLFRELGLDKGISIEGLLQEASQAIFTNPDLNDNGIKLAHIITRLNIFVPKYFKYLYESGLWHEPSFGIFLPDVIELETLFPPDYYKDHLISSKYEIKISGEKLTRWRDWIHGNKSGLRKFIPPEKINYRVRGKTNLQEFCKKRQGNPPDDYPLKSIDFFVTDFDFPNIIWNYWQEQAASEPYIWASIIQLIAQDWDNEWSDTTSAKVQQEGSSYYHGLNHGQLFSRWIEKFRKIECIPDSYNKLHYPSDLLRNTPETSALQRIEPFVHPDFDLPKYSELLDLLGVRNKPTDSGKIIDRIHALSSINPPIINEIINLYDALDRVLIRSTSDQLEEIKNIFANEKLILSDDLDWRFRTDIYQQNPDRIPGVPIVHASANHLNLWNRLEITRKPSIEDAINWVSKFLSNETLVEEDYDRVVDILQNYPTKVISDCKHWINLEKAWCPLEEITWVTDMPGKVDYLFAWVKAKTADFSMLENPREILASTGLIHLDNIIEFRVSEYKLSRYTTNPEWIVELAKNLKIVKKIREYNSTFSREILHLDNVRKHAERLANSRLMMVKPLEATPYIDGQPAGFHSAVKVLWDGIFIYVLDDQQMNYRELVDAITSPFKDQSIFKAVGDCIDRKSDWIENYFNSYFVMNKSSDENDPELKNELQSQDRIIENIIPTEDEGLSNSTEDSKTSVTTHEGGTKTVEEQNGNNKEENQKPKEKGLRAEEKFAIFIQKDQYYWLPEKKIFKDKTGNRIVFEEGLFPWVQYDVSGTILQRFRIEEGSLEKGITIPSAAWEYMKKNPDYCCLVTHDKNKFQRYKWYELNQLIRTEYLKIYPAAYLLKVIIENLDEKSE